MDLERNLIDNILECEIKLGHASIPISFYYPLSSMLELLSCEEEDLQEAISAFQEKELHRLGQVSIKEQASEKGRFAVTVPAAGVDWASRNFTPSAFIRSFVKEIRHPGNTLSDMVRLFARFSKEIDVRKISDEEWSIMFRDEAIDPYVYHIEQNPFGLEYHRFTKSAYVHTILEE